MTLLVVLFATLLTSLGAADAQLASVQAKGMQPPVSTAIAPAPLAAVRVDVFPDRVEVGGLQLLALRRGLFDCTCACDNPRETLLMTPLYSHLRVKAGARGERHDQVATIMADGRIPFSTIRNVVYTVESAGFDSRLLVQPRSSWLPAHTSARPRAVR